jgi:CubicO group peptidase (beta-lactamase class C family)
MRTIGMRELFRKQSLKAALLTSLIACGVSAQEAKPQSNTGPAIAALSSSMQSFVDAKEVAGLVTVVTDENGVVFEEAYGWSDVEKQEPMKKDSIFWIASMSKPITGFSVMLLVDEGKLALDDRVTKYLPELEALRTADGKPVEITIRNLLTHTSGMSELKPDQTYTSKTLQEAVSRYAKEPVLFQPGSKWQYSQTSINTAARVVEVVSGMSFDTFLQKRICEPLGMKDTTFYLTAEQYARLAKSYSRTDDGQFKEAAVFLLEGKSPMDKDRFPAANGGLFSTADDYARFCRMLINEGKVDGNQLLSPESVRAFRTIHTGALTTGFTPGNGWGVGCCVVRNPQGASAALSAGSFGHGGAYGTQAWVDPVKRRAYILMTQRANFPNADDSAVRKAFQEKAAKAFDKN